MEEKKSLTLPAAVLRGETLLPGMIAHFDITGPEYYKAVEEAMESDRRIFLVMRKNDEESEPSLSSLFDIGVIAVVRQILKPTASEMRITVEGRERARLLDFCFDGGEGSSSAEVEIWEVRPSLPVEEKAGTSLLNRTFTLYGKVTGKVSEELTRHILKSGSLSELIEQVSLNIGLDMAGRQRFLETPSQMDQVVELCRTMERDMGVALGVGVVQAPGALALFPEWVTNIFAKSPVVSATLMAVILNIILPKDKEADKKPQETEKIEEAASEGEAENQSIR